MSHADKLFGAFQRIHPQRFEQFAAAIQQLQMYWLVLDESPAEGG